MSYFVNVYLPHHDFEPDFTEMVGTDPDLDISLDKTTFDALKLPIDSYQCDYHETFYHPSELFSNLSVYWFDCMLIVVLNACLIWT